MKNVIIYRVEKTNDAVLGLLLIDEKICCLTLEHPYLFVPAGTYRIAMEFSARFKRDLWEIKDVPGRSECKFHQGNTQNDVTGCIAPGMIAGTLGGIRAVLQSEKALNKIHAELEGEKKHTLKIIDLERAA